MDVRFGRAIIAFIAGIGLFTGCVFDSRKPSEPLRYVALGDGTGIAMEMDFAPTIVDSGLYLAWTGTNSSSIFAHRIERALLDSAGFFVSSEDMVYDDSDYITSPRISANRIEGRVTAWIRNFRDGTATEVVVEIITGSHLSLGEVYPILADLRTAYHVTVLALPDNSFLLGVAGKDSSGTEGLWVQRFDALANPEGESWHEAGLHATDAPELIFMPNGGWTAMWMQSGPDGGRIAWQRFDADGKPDGVTRIRPLPAGSTDKTTLRAEPLPAGRILVEARTGNLVPFIIGAGGDAENDWTDAGDWEGAMLAADTLHQRYYGLRDGKLLRLDSAFRVQATRDLPALIEWPPALAVMPSGKIALVGHGAASRPLGERRALLVHTIDPF